MDGFVTLPCRQGKTIVHTYIHVAVCRKRIGSPNVPYNTVSFTCIHVYSSG